MRFHSRYPLLQFWSGADLNAISARSLGVARLEPVIRDSVSGSAILDLVFFDGERTAVVPFILVDRDSLVQRERTPIVWPEAIRAAGIEALLEIEGRLFPWLYSLTLARQQNAEAIRTFTDTAARDVFDAARSAGFLGAARYDELLPTFAPYVYAARFCHEERSVGIVDSGGANGAAMLSNRARVRADLRSAERNALASMWFGTPLFGEVIGAYDIVAAPHNCAAEARDVRITLDDADERRRIVSVASAVPLDVLISFDPEDAPVARTFSVRSNAQLTLRAVFNEHVAPAAGGSSGNILMLMREDFERAPDADVDEARALASRLTAEGFSVELRAPSTVNHEYRPDLLHAFTVAGTSVENVLARMHAAGVPIVANPNTGPAPHEAVWGPDVVSAAYARAFDDGVLAELVDLIYLRKLSTEHSTPAASAVPGLAYVDVAIVAADAEQRLLHDALGFKGKAVSYAPGYSGQVRPADDIREIAGARPFVLVHAPVDWRTNIAPLAAAAAKLDIPVVVAGPLVNFACLRYAAQLAPELIVHVPRPSEAELEALYRSAGVYADVSWGPQGLGRLARAVASGCRLLVSRASFASDGWPGAAVADPASAPSISDALERAWSAPAPAVTSSGPDLFSASIFAYSKAVAARQPA